MVRYVMLLSFTEVGASQIQNTTRRAQIVHEVAGQMGVEIESFLWTLGEYDVTAVLSAREEGTLIALAAYLTKQGYVRPRLLRAFTEDEFDRILNRMPASPEMFNLGDLSTDEHSPLAPPGG